MGLMLAVAAAWGLAEATVFFLVPDIILTWIALREGISRALWASVAACLGALAGGAVLYGGAAADAGAARDILDCVPAVSPQMIAGAGDDLRRIGFAALFTGALSGVPYKIYALEAGAMHMSVLLFLLASVPARLFRFWAAIAITGAAASILGRHFSQRTLLGMLIGFWIVFYIGYFIVMLG
jgi:membrane protein YqaA with SNARE-associated domain